MSFVHGKNTVIDVDSNDISAFVNSSEWNRVADDHDTTGYGADSHAYEGGLLNATLTMSGTYESGVTGPKAVIEPLLATKVPFIRQPEGAGSGLPQETGTALVKSYVETNPVAGMITWSAELKVSGDVDTTPQV